MAVRFKAENHSYESMGEEKIDWISVTSFVSNFKIPFEGRKTAAKCTKNKKSKWYGLGEDRILELWAAEAKRSTDLGTWYHNQRETDLTSHATLVRDGVELPIVKAIEEDGFKYAPEQKLENGIYPEHFVYLKSIGLCGQSDLVEVVNNTVNIGDYKTNKEIKMQGYKSWDGKVSKMSKPVSHLDDCHFSHYALQLSLYMYIILRHNPTLKPGKLVIYHIRFEEESKDQFDNPIYKVDEQGNYLVREVTEIELPYLKAEVMNLVTWLKTNRASLKTKH